MRFMSPVALLVPLVLFAGCAPENQEPMDSEAGEMAAEDTATDAIGATADQESLEVQMMSPEGESIGTATIEEEDGGTSITADFSGLEAGTYGFHFHEVGTCDPPDFQSAGGHFDMNDREHGFDNPEGPHDGDLPNLVIEEAGGAPVQIFNARISPEDLDDADGTALMLHSGPDDYVTDPAGDSGDRIACGVVFPQ